MASDEIKLFNSSIEVTFGKPVVFSASFVQSAAEKIESVLTARPPAGQMNLRHTDHLYNYEFVASFYGNNGGLTITGEQIKLTLNNGIGAAGDVPFMVGIIKRFGTHFRVDKPSAINFQVAAHFDYKTVEARDLFLKQFAPSDHVVSPGAYGYVKTDETPFEARILIEPSFSHHTCVYATSLVEIPDFVNWEEKIEGSLESMNVALRVFGINAVLQSSVP